MGIQNVFAKSRQSQKDRSSTGKKACRYLGTFCKVNKKDGKKRRTVPSTYSWLWAKRSCYLTRSLLRPLKDISLNGMAARKLVQGARGQTPQDLFSSASTGRQQFSGFPSASGKAISEATMDDVLRGQWLVTELTPTPAPNYLQCWIVTFLLRCKSTCAPAYQIKKLHGLLWLALCCVQLWQLICSFSGHDLISVERWNEHGLQDIFLV